MNSNGKGFKALEVLKTYCDEKGLDRTTMGQLLRCYYTAIAEAMKEPTHFRINLTGFGCFQIYKKGLETFDDYVRKFVTDEQEKQYYLSKIEEFRNTYNKEVQRKHDFKELKKNLEKQVQDI